MNDKELEEWEKHWETCEWYKKPLMKITLQKRDGNEIWCGARKIVSYNPKEISIQTRVMSLKLWYAGECEICREFYIKEGKLDEMQDPYYIEGKLIQIHILEVEKE